MEVHVRTVAPGDAKGRDLEAGSSSGSGKNAPSPPQQPVPKAPSYFSLFRFATGQDKVLVALGVLCGIAGGAVMPVFTIFLGKLVNAIGNPGKDFMDAVVDNVLRSIYLGLAGLVAGYLEVACFKISGKRQANRVRQAYVESILKQDLTWYDTESSVGKAVQGLNEHMSAFEAAIGHRVGGFARGLSTAAVGITVGLVLGWKLALVVIATMPALMLCTIAVNLLTKRLQARVLASNARANDLAQEALGNIKTVTAFNMASTVVPRYNAELAGPETAGVQQSSLCGLLAGVTMGVTMCSIALGTWYGSILVAEGDYTGGKVASIIMSIMSGGFALGQAMPLSQYFQRGTVAASHLYKVIFRKPAVDVDAPGTVLPEVHGDIELEDVTFAYPAQPNRKIFNGFSLVIPAGTTVALVGESGSGKSTIIQLIERFYDPLQGRVLLDGHDLKSLQLKWLRSQVALVSQEPTLFDTSIFNNITCASPGASLQDVIAAAKAANCHDFISKLPQGYDTCVGDKGGQLSGGQRQRIAIARAVLRNPRILLLDEATSALDAQSEQAVQDALSSLMGGRTTVVIAHRLSTITTADDIAVVCDGKVIEHGPHSELMKIPGGFYAGMVARQNLVPSDEVEDEGEEEGGLRKKFGQKAKSKKPTLRQSVLKRASVRLSIIPQDIARKLSMSAEARATGVEPEGVDFSRLLQINRPEWGYAALGVVAAIAAGVSMPGFGWAMSGVMSVYYEPDPDDVKAGGRKWGLIFTGMSLGMILVNLTQGWCFGILGQRLARRVRVMYLNAVLRQDIAWFDDTKNSTGEVMSRLSSDTAVLKGGVGDVIGLFTQLPAMLIAALVIAFTASWSLALVILAVLPIMVFGQMVQLSQMFDAEGEQKDEASAANQIAIEAIGAIRVVSAYSLQDDVTERYKQTVMGTSRSNKNAHIAGLVFGFFQLTSLLVLCLIFWFSGREIQKGNLSLEDMMRSSLVIFYTASGIGIAVAQFPDTAKAGPAANRLFSIIDSEPSAAKPGAQPLIDGEVELKRVTFAYPTRPGRLIFKEFSLKIDAGTSCALVGESGHGKSTIIGLLERFYDALDGQVLIDGINVQSLDAAGLRSQIGLVGQEPIMFSGSILDNIRVGNPNATLSQVVEAARVANALGFIEKLPDSYDTRLGPSGIQLSGGQKQRISIARAVLRNPRILMLDEATAALDAESERLVQEALDVVMVGRTTIIIAHRLATVVNCTKIAAIYRGRVLEEGTHQQLMELNRYYAYLAKVQST